MNDESCIHDNVEPCKYVHQRPRRTPSAFVPSAPLRCTQPVRFETTLLESAAGSARLAVQGRRHLRRSSSSWMSAAIASCHLWSIITFPAVNRRPIPAPAFLARTTASSTRWLQYPCRRHLLHPAHHFRGPAHQTPNCAIQVHHKIDANMHIAA